MTVFKCKMCSAPIEVTNGMTVCECEHCGSKQTLPKLDSGKRLDLYNRANHFRYNNEYDKAKVIYEKILNEDTTDAEAYWSLVLCKYGIEYIEDSYTHKRMPTMNRTQYTSVFDDPNYKMVLKYADTMQYQVYENEANIINEIQKETLAEAQEKEPFDVFLCCEETNVDGQRTRDSFLATDLYQLLTNEGFKVFFARTTLEDKLGMENEPYVFAALNSAKVMVVIGTKPEYFNAVYVKNEWSRYLTFIKMGQRKILIPVYQDMDSYDLPVEFSHLQALDMTTLGFMENLISTIKKLVPGRSNENISERGINNIEAILRRMELFLEDKEWDRANEYAEKILDVNPECAEAYLGKLLAELHVSSKEKLRDVKSPFDFSNNYKKVMRFGNEEMKEELSECIKYICKRNELNRIESIYEDAKNKIEEDSELNYKAASKLLKKISGWKDADELVQLCSEELKQIKIKKTLRFLLICLVLVIIGLIDIRILFVIGFISLIIVSFIIYKLLK